MWRQRLRWLEEGLPQDRLLGNLQTEIKRNQQKINEIVRLFDLLDLRSLELKRIDCIQAHL